MFNAAKYLDDAGISYRTSGPNVARGYVNINCPFCGDRSFHRGISNTGYTACWRCEPHGLKALIKELENCSWKDAENIIEKYSTDGDVEHKKDDIVHPSVIRLPEEFSEDFPEPYKNYLKKRRYDFAYLRKKYNILCCSDPFSDYKYRIIFPIYENGRVVSYVGRDVTGKQSIPYLYCEEKNAVVPKKELIFGLDYVKKDTVILVEGLFNQLRFGDGCLALLTANFTKEQVLKLKNKGLRKFYICFDNDETGKRNAKKLESMLTFADDIWYIDLPSDINDADELDNNTIKTIKIQTGV